MISTCFKMVFFLGAFMLFASFGALAADQVEAITEDFHDETISGHPSGPVIAEEPCIHGESQHFKINGEGELRLEDRQLCGHTAVWGAMMLCFLGPDLTCASKEGPNPAIKLKTEKWFKIGKKGVAIAGTLYPWADPNSALKVLPLIKKISPERCNRVLFWQSTYKKSGISPPDKGYAINGYLAEEACGSMLEDLCASLKDDNIVRLSNKADITNLCK